MTANIVTFIKRDLRDLVHENLSEEGDISRFWLMPCAPDDPEYKDLAELGEEIFRDTTLDDYLDIDGIRLATLRCSISTAILAYTSESYTTNLPPEEFGLEISDVHFIQRAKFAAKARVIFTRSIPLRVANEAILEADLLEYFPQIMSFKPMQNGADDCPRVAYAKVMLYIEQDKGFIRLLKDSLIELADTIPKANHEWLYNQLYSVIRSRKIENAFLGLYRILEFFFPLQNVLELREKIAFADTNLNLVRHCIDTLQWHIGHYKGAQSSVNFSGCGFAEISLNKRFSKPAESPTLEKLKDSEKKFKIKAMELLSSVRHDLTHQNFNHKNYEPDEMLRYCEALISYLIEAFANYTKISFVNGSPAIQASELEEHGVSTQ